MPQRCGTATVAMTAAAPRLQCRSLGSDCNVERGRRADYGRRTRPRPNRSHWQRLQSRVPTNTLALPFSFSYMLRTKGLSIHTGARDQPRESPLKGFLCVAVPRVCSFVTDPICARQSGATGAEAKLGDIRRIHERLARGEERRHRRRWHAT